MSSSDSSQSNTKNSSMPLIKNHQIGLVEKYSINNGIFEANFNQFNTKNFANDPSLLISSNTTTDIDKILTSSSSLLHNTNVRSAQSSAHFATNIPGINPHELTTEQTEMLTNKRKRAHEDAWDLQRWQGPLVSREIEENEALRNVDPTLENLSVAQKKE
jgi:hypothetical protein